MEDAFVHICPHCDKEIVVTVHEIFAGDGSNFRTARGELREERCPHCGQWFQPSELDTCSMIEDGEISSNVDYEATEHEIEQAKKFYEKVRRGEYPKPWFPTEEDD